jgi:cation diffusion facilitator family transporter
VSSDASSSRVPAADRADHAAGGTDVANAAGQRRTAITSILAATLLVLLKLVTGLLTGSLALVSAGIESSGDVVAAVVTFFAIRFGARPADSEHPYGHRRVENLSALAEAMILVGGGVFVVIEAVGRLAEGGEALDVAWYVFAVIGAAICIDVSRLVVSVRTSRRYGSAALRSNAFHFAADLAGSLAVLAGLLAVAAGFEEGDAFAALVVAVIIFAAATRLILENARVLIDTAPAAAQESAREAVAALEPGVELRRLRLRESAGRYFADVTVAIPPASAVVEGHAVADDVEGAIEAALPGSDVVVHVEPQRRGLDLRDDVLAAALGEPLVREAHDITIFEHGDKVSVSLHLKLPEDLSLQDAHEVAERVEDQIRVRPEVLDVQTHLEPLERPLRSASSGGSSAREIDRTVTEFVRQHSGHAPREVRVLPSEIGSVVFLTVPVDAAVSLSEAHRIASELEHALREELPELAEVVVHTEP